MKALDCSTQISHEFAAFFLPFDVSYLLLVYTYVCKIASLAAIYFMTTFILSEYYKLERGRFITTPSSILKHNPNLILQIDVDERILNNTIDIKNK